MAPPMHVVVGTRPELHKLHTIVSALRDANRLGAILWSGQHTTLTRTEQAAPPWLGAIDLGLPASGDPIDYTVMLAGELQDHLDRLPPGPVIVQGDTATANAGANAAHEIGLPVYHVEAGVRTGDTDDPWPEELFRRNIDTIAGAGCCATTQNQANLRDKDRFPVTGNPGIDRSLQLVRPTPHRQHHLLVTLHRRESFGEPLAQFIDALCQWASHHPDAPVLWPTHPNPNVQNALPHDSPIILLPPLEHRSFLQLLATARAVLTDSGGVQEEAATYGIPAIIARRHTDRPESIDSGHALLCPNPTHLHDALDRATRFQLRSTPSSLYGDGHATARILTHLTTLYP